MAATLTTLIHAVSSLAHKCQIPPTRFRPRAAPKRIASRSLALYRPRAVRRCPKDPLTATPNMNLPVDARPDPSGLMDAPNLRGRLPAPQHARLLESVTLLTLTVPSANASISRHSGEKQSPRSADPEPSGSKISPRRDFFEPSGSGPADLGLCFSPELREIGALAHTESRISEK